MISQKQTAESIDDKAAQWAARLDVGQLNAAEAAAFQAWVGSDSRCFGALARAQAVLIGSGAPVTLADAIAARRQLMQPNRRWILGGAAVGGLAVAGLAITMTGRYSKQPLHFSSEIGELRHIPLADGSRLTLNTDTTLEVDYTENRRTIRLLCGEAFFEVAKDPARPFIVVGPKAQVRTVGTTYSVRLNGPEEMTVLVATGRVAIETVGRTMDAFTALRRLWRNDPPEGGEVLVEAGQEARIRKSGSEGNGAPVTVTVLPIDSAARALLWRDGKLYFEGAPLAGAVAEFARYNYRRIVIRDATLANARISGLFAADDPEGFARAVALSIGARADTAGSIIILDK